MREPDVQGILFAGLDREDKERLKESYKGIKVSQTPHCGGC